MPNKTRAVREIPFADIEQCFRLGSYWFGSRWCPAVSREDNGGYRIRVVASETWAGDGATTTKYDYFAVGQDGAITSAPRGFARDYRPGRIPVAQLDKAVGRFATPDPRALRLNLGGA
jgi:hypothetical protein